MPAAPKNQSAPLIPAEPQGGDDAVIAAAAAVLDNPATMLHADNPVRVFVIGEASRKYLFRSIKGILRGCELVIDYPEDWWDDPQDDPKSHMSKGNARVYKQGWARRNKDPKRRQLLQEAYDDLGGHKITFVKAPAVARSDDPSLEDHTQIEVYYQTDSDAVAQVIREAIEQKRGDFQFIYEVDQSSHLKVGDQRFARTPVGLKLAYDYMAASGETSIEVEAKAS